MTISLGAACVLALAIGGCGSDDHGGATANAGSVGQAPTPDPRELMHTLEVLFSTDGTVGAHADVVVDGLALRDQVAALPYMLRDNPVRIEMGQPKTYTDTASAYVNVHWVNRCDPFVMCEGKYPPDRLARPSGSDPTKQTVYWRYDNGKWRIDRDSFCALADIGRVQCPSQN
ncbi:hypothetical protein [Gordonia jinhuaensis]|uniref:hypothetical protein n=1 Tax=Gordonia jinhuaensis TaxID=1517702 RepID=UPI001667EB13|nr:hypothetical protein [Gordonia jinhuaensis]